MERGDFYGSEQSAVIDTAGNAAHRADRRAGQDHGPQERRSRSTAGDVVAAAVDEPCARCAPSTRRRSTTPRRSGLLLSLHLKATMMKVSDPIMFGHAVATYYQDVFDKHAATVRRARRRSGQRHRRRLRQDPVAAGGAEGGHRGRHPGRSTPHGRRWRWSTRARASPTCTCRATSSSTPRCRRPSARRVRCGDPTAQLHDTKAMIPDRCYAGIYQAVDRRLPGARRVRRPHDGHRVQRRPDGAEGRGVRLARQDVRDAGRWHRPRASTAAGRIAVRAPGRTRRHLAHVPDEGSADPRLGQAGRATGAAPPATPRSSGSTSSAPTTAADRQRRSEYLKDHDIAGLDIRILSPVEAIKATLVRVRAGLDTISVTGNVLRDYLTDLFPILELGTSAKMLSIVPLLAGRRTLRNRRRRLGAEARAAVPAGELPALGFARRVPGARRLDRGPRIRRPATPGRPSSREALDRANGRILENDKSPQRKVGEIDNRGSHFYLAMYWARALADQTRRCGAAGDVRPDRRAARAERADDRRAS